MSRKVDNALGSICWRKLSSNWNWYIQFCLFNKEPWKVTRKLLHHFPLRGHLLLLQIGQAVLFLESDQYMGNLSMSLVSCLLSTYCRHLHLYCGGYIYNETWKSNNFAVAVSGLLVINGNIMIKNIFSWIDINMLVVLSLQVSLVLHLIILRNWERKPCPHPY